MNKYTPVTHTIRWHELFQKEMSATLRRKRWETWKAAAIAQGEEGQEMVDYWAKDNVEETCAGCVHRDSDWCKDSELPCNVNPILTINEGMIGMACQGVGYEAKVEQGDLFKSEAV